MTKISEQHHKSEKSKKDQIQTLSLNALKSFINKWEIIKQNKSNNLKEIFIEKNENWHKIILQKIKKLKIQENDNLMTCEWSYWITCHNNKYEEH